MRSALWQTAQRAMMSPSPRGPSIALTDSGSSCEKAMTAEKTRRPICTTMTRDLFMWMNSNRDAIPSVPQETAWIP
jgi:hypothetical protein